MIDVFAVMLAGMVVCISPVPTQGTTIPDSVVVLAMMAPLQFVLMCAAVMAGMHLWRKDGSRLSAALGMGLPVLAGLVSLVAIV